MIFAYHGYPWLIHRLTYRRHNHANIHVRGYKEEGTTTTPFDMTVMNDLDRYHLVIDVIDRVPESGPDRRLPAPRHAGPPDPPTGVHPRARRGPARDPGLDLAPLTEPRLIVRILVVNAGSQSVKLRVIGDDDELLAARDLGPPDDHAWPNSSATSSTMVGERRRGRPPGGARRPPLHHTGAHRHAPA